MEQTKKLYRSKSDRIIFGVCGGMAKYFDIDPIMIRLVFVVLTIGAGSGVLIYLICALIIPSEDEVVIVGEKKEVDSKAEEFINEIGKKVNNLSSEVKKNDWRFFIGLLLVLVGLSSLFASFIPFRQIFIFFWPLLIIFVGLVVLFKKK
ncbi:hypothetical protein CVU82_01305 [Candidatus Falkowbacteria bacterium HGW-Falkowbacteria-1]|jgi:phage shock protein C|uniref:Phage shock protein PspC N-terminal domain-containing protein n=1 Tax=Candidatus Falkowbacteria bacterium HGW-Falkowbacteria-1 TaxID=2013768 RepID=A0A2N2EAX2_9BACT|nr:MAG: hypothetical protein CVU82_01305 [Candidatus Falkowbacteria bacterium HGW-Falkowbacteria-1]